MLGTLIGDIVGSAYEFSHFKGKDFVPLFHPKARFTDDTVCTVAVADALIRGTYPQANLIDWCKRYAESGGWGKQFALWFLDDNPQPYGSWGNGAAMRIAPVGLLASTEAEAIGWSDTVTALTHNHPDAMHTAQAVALAIYWARRKTSAQDIGQQLIERYGYPLHLTPDDIRPSYKRTEKAIDSVPQALGQGSNDNVAQLVVEVLWAVWCLTLSMGALGMAYLIRAAWKLGRVSLVQPTR